MDQVAPMHLHLHHQHQHVRYHHLLLCQILNVKIFLLNQRKVEIILDSYISEIKNNRDKMKEERKQERLEKEEKREQRWKVNRAERKEVHKETSEIQRSLVHLLGQLVEKQNEPR